VTAQLIHARTGGGTHDDHCRLADIDLVHDEVGSRSHAQLFRAHRNQSLLQLQVDCSGLGSQIRRRAPQH
jgi:hypothetical protein